LRQGDAAGALRTWDALRAQHPDAFLLVIQDYLAAAAACGMQTQAHAALALAYQQLPAVELLQALQTLEDPGDPQQLPRLLAQLQKQPSLSAAQLLLAMPPASLTPAAWDALQLAVARSAQPLQRYRCAACGFEAQRYFWQCPGCLSWDSYPPQRIDAL
jgi:lipopolysaccharide biosynthesis regulator YciM